MMMPDEIIPRETLSGLSPERPELGALDLLDQLPDTDEEARRDWLPESSIVALVELAEVLRVAQTEERRQAPILAAQLERQPETRARLQIDHQAHFQTWGLAEELLERTLQAIYNADPCRAVRIARLAVAVADHLDTDRYLPSLTIDLRARAWASLGNSYRCAGQLGAAAAALNRAAEILVDGTGDPIEEATLLSFQASLETDLGNFDQAIASIERTCSIYRDIGEERLLARSCVQLTVPSVASDPAGGYVQAERAESLIDAEQDPRLFLIARHNRIRALVDLGEPERASMLLEASRKHYRRVSEVWSEIGLAWTEARLSAALGHLEEAEAAFVVLLDEVLERGYQLDSALVALDLAACHLSRGRTAEASELAASMTPHLQACGAHHRAREAWALLQQALQTQRATTELIHEISQYLRRYWNNPDPTLPARLKAERARVAGG